MNYVKKNADLRLWKANEFIKKFVKSESNGKVVGIYLSEKHLGKIISEHPDDYLVELTLLRSALQHQTFFADNREMSGLIDLKCYHVDGVGGIVETTFALEPRKDCFYVANYSYDSKTLGEVPWQELKSSYRRTRFMRDKIVHGEYWKK